MPRRSDLKSVLVIGSGPIVIGQGCEFDYSGTQACRVLKAEGIRVSLVNSNPATIMTDPEFADATYVEPITVDVLEKVIAIERPDAVLPTLGGQTALNAAVELHEAGILARYGTELIGARIDAIKAGEDRERFKEIVTSLPPLGGGADGPGDVPQVPDSRICHSLEGAFTAADSSATRSSSAPPTPSAAPAPGSPGPGTNCAASPAPGWTPAPPPKSCWRSRSSAGRSSSSSSCATATTTWSWSARSRTSTRWACTPATR